MSEEVKGKIVQVIGTVVDIRFPSDNLPPIYGAIYVTNPTINDKPDNLILEVAQHVGDSTVRQSPWKPLMVYFAARMLHIRVRRSASLLVIRFLDGY
jgi:hypothetical protein